MNRTTFALFVALLIHLVLFLLLWIFISNIPDAKKTKQLEHKIKISLKEMPQKPQPQKIIPPIPKGKQLKKIVQFEPKKPTKQPILNKPKVKPLPKKPQPKVEPLPPTKPYIPLMEPKNESKKPKKKQKKDPMAWMYEDKSANEKKSSKKKMSSGSNISQDIKELYGEEFKKLTAGQQQYIIDNQEIMRRITQQVLNRVARVNLPRDLNVNRSNVIEFYLHPNGDMTDFRFLSKSGYYILDDTTKETIEYAYSRYPRPQEKTLIRYNVYYNLARY